MEPDEAPVRQSHRAEFYADAVERLVAAGSAYRCDCTPDVVKARTAGNATPGYDGFCRDRDVPARPGVVVRFRTPDEGTTGWDDVVRGTVTFEHANLEDFVIQRSDGSATFFLPNAVDDVDMGITHVIRGEDLINVTPKVLLIRGALGHIDRPVFAHLPLLVNEKRQKLSKRRDDVSVEDYRDRGYLAEAMTNYLALLGWGPPDGIEVRPRSEIVELFRLEDVTKASAFFDIQKLQAINADHIRLLDVKDFAERCRPWLQAPFAPWAPEAFDETKWQAVAPHAQTRLKVLSEITDNVDFLFLPEPVEDEASWTKAMKEGSDALLRTAREKLEAADWTSAESLKEAVLAAGEAHGLKLGKAQAPVRVAVTGRTVGLPLFESLEVLGKDTTLARIDAALAKLAA
jgi:glutamyl-tRNA synthetase